MICGSIETAVPPKDVAFDLITLHFVLEHLHEPLAAPRRVAGWLKPEGLCLILVPNLPAASPGNMAGQGGVFASVGCAGA